MAQFSKALVAIDKVHTVPQRALHCRLVLDLIIINNNKCFIFEMVALSFTCDFQWAMKYHFHCGNGNGNGNGDDNGNGNGAVI